MFCPQPRRLPEPFTSRSAAPNGFESENEIDARCGIRNFARSSVTLSDAFDVHGPRQLFRAAILPSCFSQALARARPTCSRAAAPSPPRAPGRPRSSGA